MQILQNMMLRHRITYEKQVVQKMVRLYCRHKEGNRELCAACRELEEYALARLDHCPFGEQKGACRTCSVHCYKPDMQKRMQQVMRYAGPRMILFHPLDAIRHLMGKLG